MKLNKGDSINELTLPSVDGSTFNLETIKGTVSYTHLTLPTNREV